MPQTQENSLPHFRKNKCRFFRKSTCRLQTEDDFKKVYGKNPNIDFNQLFTEE